MKKLFSLVLAVAMVLSMACFASAEENTTLTIVAWHDAVLSGAEGSL